MEDCCAGNEKEQAPIKEHENKGGKTKMDKKIILWIIIAILAVLVIYVVFFRGIGSGQAIAAVSQTARSSSSGMVGGC